MDRLCFAAVVVSVRVLMCEAQGALVRVLDCVKFRTGFNVPNLSL